MNRVERGLAWWAGVIEKIGWILASGILLLSIVSAIYVKNNLGVNTKTAEMFSPDLPFRIDKDRLGVEFSQLNDMLVVVVELESPEFNRSFARELSNRLLDETDSVADVFFFGETDFFTRHGLLFLSPEELEDYSVRLAEAQPFLSELMADPSLRGLFRRLTQVVTHDDDLDTEAVERFLSRVEEAIKANLADEPYLLSWQEFMQDADDDSVPRQLLFVNPRMDFSRLLPAGPAIESVRQIADDLIQEMSVTGQVRLTGDVALGFEEMRAAKDGAIQAAVLAFILVTILLSAGLRSPRLIGASVITLLCGLSITAGFATLWVGTLNMISLAFAVLYIGLGVDYAIHLCLHYRNALFEGKSPREALALTLRRIGVALALCSASTSLGFYVFLFTDFQGVSELGIIAGSGMVVSLLVSLTLMPAILHYFPVKKTPPKWTILSKSLRARMLAAPQEYPRAVRLASVAAAGAALLALPGVTFDNDPLNLRDRESESVQTLFDLIEDDQASPWTIEMLFSDLDEAIAASGRLSRIETVDRVVSLQSFVPENQDLKLDQVFMMDLILGGLFVDTDDGAEPPSAAERVRALEEFAMALAANADGDAPTHAQLEATLHHFLDRLSGKPKPELESMLLGLEHKLLATFGLAMKDLRLSLTAGPVGLEDLPPRLAARWANERGLFRIQVFPDPSLRSQEELQAFADDVRRAFPHATGDLVVTIEAGNVVVRAFQQAFLYAVAAIVLLLLLYTRSWKDTGLILLPLLLAAALTAAAMVALGIPFNFANVIALPLLLGYGVNNGIHVVHRVRSTPPGELFLETSTARAVLYSSLTTISSFGMLSFSPHDGTASMGIVLTLGLFFTLIATLISLPAFLTPTKKRIPPV